MNNAELIAALRYCGNFEDREGCDEECPYFNDKDCPKRIMCDAADALEAAEQRIAELEKQIPKEGEWLRTDAFPHRVYCSCCYKTYVPNENWQIWQDDADNFGLPRNYCPNCGAKMDGADGERRSDGE